jgi:ubiquinone/menaquinone biosynthesis C-methylase UbiE
MSNEHVVRVFDKFAPKYDATMARWERYFLGGGRQWATTHARGDVLELAVGTGLNLPAYSAATTVLGVELSRNMLAIAERRVAENGLTDRVQVQLGDVQALDVADESRDTVVSTYTFCTIPDPMAASREAFRVLRPGGRFLLVEHGASSNRAICLGQRAVEPLTVRFVADHLTRDPVAYVQEAGFRIDDVQRSRAGIVFRVAATKAA